MRRVSPTMFGIVIIVSFVSMAGCACNHMNCCEQSDYCCSTAAYASASGYDGTYSGTHGDQTAPQPPSLPVRNSYPEELPTAPPLEI